MRSRMLRVTLFGCAVSGLAVAGLAGCATTPAVKEKSAREWFDEGQGKLAEKKKFLSLFEVSPSYDEAIEAFREASKGYRDADLDSQIQIALADAYFAKEDYPMAAEAYGEFLRLHAHNSRSDWAQYQIGMSHLKQVRGADRSQESALRALAAFEVLVRSYPRSAWVSKAQENVLACRRHIADHERYVGDFYYRTGGYAAAAGRYETIVRAYGDTGLADEALYQLGRCYIKLQQDEKAAQLFDQLRRDFPQSRFVKELDNQKG